MIYQRCKERDSVRNCSECGDDVCKQKRCSKSCIACIKIVCEKCRAASGREHPRCEFHRNDRL